MSKCLQKAGGLTNRVHLINESDMPDDGVRALAQRSATANAALVRGDIDGHLALIKPSKDYVLMAPSVGRRLAASAQRIAKTFLARSIPKLTMAMEFPVCAS